MTTALFDAPLFLGGVVVGAVVTALLVVSAVEQMLPEQRTQPSRESTTRP